MANKFNQILLDIETGGIDPSQSSILSIAAGAPDSIRTKFARPIAGTFLSRFSEEKIIPQLKQASTLSSERSVIESLISTLKDSPTATLAGYNIRGFDVGFIQRRAREYGLESSFKQALGKRAIQDPVYQVKDIIASSIMGHAESGTFQQELGGMSWPAAQEAFGNLGFKQRPVEYNLLSQISGYLKASRETAMFKGWKLEDIHKILTTHGAASAVAGSAHEAATDLAMTSDVIQAARSGKLAEVFSQPSAAKQWMSIVKERGYHQFGAGRLLSQSDIKEMGLARSFRIPPILKDKRVLIGAGIAAAAIYAANKFTAKDDEYNTIEGLPHGGFAQTGRLQLTDFGSGYQGDKSKERNSTTSVPVFSTITAIGGAPNVLANFKIARDYFRGYMVAYHGTPIANKASILQKGLIPNAEAIKNYRQIPAYMRNPIIEAQMEEKATRVFFSAEPWVSRSHAAMGDGFGPLIENMHSAVGQVTGYYNPKVWQGKNPGAIFKFRIPMENVTHQSGMAAQLKSVLGTVNIEGKLGDAISQGYSHFVQATMLSASPTIDISAEHPITPDMFEEVIPTREGKIFWNEATNLNTPGISSTRMIGKGVMRAGMALVPIAAAVYAVNQFTGKDDGYNTIEGLLHGGEAQKKRKELTEFGSGWVGILSKILINPITDDLVVFGVKMYGNRVSGKDDDHNTIEGLGHKGIAHKMRRRMTPFGSGWDALRNLTKAGESFESMISSDEFKLALKGAAGVKKMGEGGFGAAFHMRGNFRGQEFNFIRKIGQIGEHEASTMQKFQHSFAPSLYHQGQLKKTGENYIDMEMFSGKEFKRAAEAGELTKGHVAKFQQALEEMHDTGLVHNDPHWRNIFLTKEGNVGLIDFGLAGKEGEGFAVLGRRDKPNTVLGTIKPGGQLGKELEAQGHGLQGTYNGVTSHGYFDRRHIAIDNVAIDLMERQQRASEGVRLAKMANDKTVLAQKTVFDEAFSPTAATPDGLTKKAAQADLNRAATADTWKAGMFGGRRSRL